MSLILLDEKSELDKDFRDTLNKTLIVEQRNFQKAAKPVVKDEESKDSFTILSSSVLDLSVRSFGKWHTATFLLRKARKDEPLIKIEEAPLYTIQAGLNSYSEATRTYNSLYMKDNIVYSGTNEDITYRVTFTWREQ